MSELMDEAVIRAPFDMAMESELSRKQFYDRANSALSELIELRAYKEAAEKQEPVSWVTEDTVDLQLIDGRPRRIWWENKRGIGKPIYEFPQPAVAVPESYITLAEKLITKVCCIAVERLNEVAPDQDWDSGEVVAEIYIRELRAMLSASPAPSHSQQSEPSTNVWESALLDAANAVVHANQNNTGSEPSRSLLACRIDDLREILDDANIDSPGDTDRCPSHDSEQIAEGTPSGYTLVSNELIDFLHGKCAYKGKWFGDAGRGKFWWRDHLPRGGTTDRCPSYGSEQGE